MEKIIDADVNINLPQYVRVLMNRLESAGEEVYLVGGSLRDMLLGDIPHDFDLATSASPERTAELFCDMRVIKTGLKHGTVTVISDGEPVEITTFRIDGAYTDTRHPDSVTFTKNIREDLSRRDFTVNAMAYSQGSGVIDPFGGKDDLARRILRAVGDPAKRFCEDALRIMRAFRFSAQLDFFIEPKTLSAAAECKGGLEHIARERIASEFLRLLMAEAPASAIREMRRAGVLPYVTEEYCPSDAILDALAHSPKNDIARLGLFFAEADEAAARDILRGLKYSNKQITGACAVSRCSAQTVCSEQDARRLRAMCGVYAPLAAAVSELLGVSPLGAYALVERSQSSPCTLSDLAIGGRELLEIGIFGKDIGGVLENLLRRVIEDPSLNEKDTLIMLAKRHMGM